MKVGQFLGKRLLRLGWLILVLALVQIFVSHASEQPGLSRTARLPPSPEVATAG